MRGQAVQCDVTSFAAPARFGRLLYCQLEGLERGALEGRLILPDLVAILQPTDVGLGQVLQDRLVTDVILSTADTHTVS